MQCGVLWSPQAKGTEGSAESPCPPGAGAAGCSWQRALSHQAPAPAHAGPQAAAPQHVSLGRRPDGVGLDLDHFGNKRPQTPCLSTTHVSCLSSGCRKSRGGRGVCVPSRGSSEGPSAGLLEGKAPAHAGPWLCFTDPCACPRMSSDCSPPGAPPPQCGHMY